MSRFTVCLGKVLGHEGGLSDYKADRGGRTNYGVTSATYNAYRTGLRLPRRPVDQITMEEVEAIYLTYWKESRCDVLPEPLDYLVFDCAINSGASRAIKLLQFVLGADVDGKVGQQTVKAIHEEVVCMGIDSLGKEYLDARREFYQSIVERDPSQSVFIAGWNNRIDKLAKDIA